MGPDVRGLAVVEPLPVRVSRSVPEAGSFEAHREAGLERYSSGDYGTATHELALALEIRPDDGEVELYLGSAELLSGNLAEARTRLRAASEHAARPRIREEALWQLANLELAADHAAEASRLLERVIGLEGQRQAAARALVDSLP
jgi:Flp pilus assembly protein TadD